MVKFFKNWFIFNLLIYLILSLFYDINFIKNDKIKKLDKIDYCYNFRYDNNAWQACINE